jgi:hypothetical protein
VQGVGFFFAESVAKGVVELLGSKRDRSVSVGRVAEDGNADLN